MESKTARVAMLRLRGLESQEFVGPFNSIMSEILESLISFHIVNPDVDPRSERSKAAQELIDVLRTYLR